MQTLSICFIFSQRELFTFMKVQPLAWEITSRYTYTFVIFIHIPVFCNNFCEEKFENKVFQTFPLQGTTMNTLTDEHILNISRRLNDKYKIRQLGFKLGLNADEIENHLVKHSPDTSEGAYSMLRSWISRINDRQVAHQKLREALKEAALHLYNSEVLASQSQMEHNANSCWNIMIVPIWNTMPTVAGIS